MSKQTRGHGEVEIQTDNLTASFYFNEAFISLQSRTSTDQDRFTNHQEIKLWEEIWCVVLCCGWWTQLAHWAFLSTFLLSGLYWFWAKQWAATRSHSHTAAWHLLLVAVETETSSEINHSGSMIRKHEARKEIVGLYTLNTRVLWDLQLFKGTVHYKIKSSRVFKYVSLKELWPGYSRWSAELLVSSLMLELFPFYWTSNANKGCDQWFIFIYTFLANQMIIFNEWFGL